MEKKGSYLGAYVDENTLRILDIIARTETEGNRSMAVRKLIREAALQRELVKAADKEHA